MNRSLYVPPFLSAVLAGMLSPLAGSAAAHPAGEAEFFEKKIRPVLVQECYECHSEEAKKIKGGLRLDTREGLLRGGESGVALVPGKSAESLLVAALKHQSPEMPPKKKLSQEVIDHFIQWIDSGAVDPRTDTRESSAAAPTLDIEKGRRHWAFQQPTKADPPEVRNAAWARNAVDRFILATLEKQGLQPVAPATKRELIRRATFDLTGLPPTPQEVAAFEADTTPEAFSRVVDRLLASPQYGERWARHWMDVARYAEDQAHTFGVKPNDSGFRYRDWVIESLNADMPYNEFVRRQIAVDQCEGIVEQNRHQIAALGFFGLGAVYYKNSDAAKAAADELDDRIDTLTRGFLGLTVSCARCHDHKFDPIPTQDYYSLAGVFQSSKLLNAPLAPEEDVKTYNAAQKKIQELEAQLKKILSESKNRVAEARIAEASRYLLALWKQTGGGTLKTPRSLAEIARQENLLEPLLKQWAEAADKKNHDKFPALKPWFDVVAASAPNSPPGGPVEIPRGVVAAAESVQRALESALEKRDGQPRPPRGGVLPEQPQQAKFKSAIIQGDARSADVDLDITGARQLVLVVTDAGDGINSDHGIWCEPRLTGPAGEKRLTDLSWKNARTVYSTVKVNASFNGGPLRIGAQTFAYGLGTHAFAEITYDLPEGYTRFRAKVGLAGNAPGSVQFAVYFGPPSDLPRPKEASRSAEMKQAEAFLAPFMGDKGFLRPSDKEIEGVLTGEEQQKCAEIKTVMEQARKEAPPMYPVAHVITDATPADMQVFIRGNPARRGDVAPRRFLRVLCEGEPQKFTHGSGRRELADAIASSRNPLTARVMVNRIWQRHFGRGLVGTPSNFGTLGEKPTHPELLDYLAVTFVEKGWSIKAMHRELMLSATYQLSSLSHPVNEQTDADNRFLWRMNRNRLDIESWRDALLAVSGQLELKMGGPSVNLGNAENRRRTVYSKISRHDLDSLLRLFDFPDANISSDKRTETTVPQQQLFVLNSPFMLQQARAFAARIQKNTQLADDAARIHHAFQLAFGRDASAREMQILSDYLNAADPEETRSENTLTRWERVTQNILASNEFLYVD